LRNSSLPVAAHTVIDAARIPKNNCDFPFISYYPYLNKVKYHPYDSRYRTGNKKSRALCVDFLLFYCARKTLYAAAGNIMKKLPSEFFAG
jgi:hypothetical protein